MHSSTFSSRSLLLCASSSLQSTRRSTSSARVFDRSLKQQQRGHLLTSLTQSSFSYDYVRREVSMRLLERLCDIKRIFPVVADIGCDKAILNEYFTTKSLRQIKREESDEKQDNDNDNDNEVFGISKGVEVIVSVDSHAEVIENASRTHHERIEQEKAVKNKRYTASNDQEQNKSIRSFFVQSDEEKLGLATSSFDLVLSCMSLHFINDLPAVFAEIKRVLKPDGCFLAAIVGGSTLQELRSAFSLVDRERTDNLHSHLSPFVDGRTVGDLLSAAGFALPTIDCDTLTVRFPDMFTLMHHLQQMGESNAPVDQLAPVSPCTFLAAASAYDALYKDEEGLVPATLQVFYLIAWAPHESQPKPKARGSAKHRLSELAKMTNKEKS